MSVEFWTLFYYGASETICSTHRSFDAALRAAAACERRGGADHRIVEVRASLPYKPPTRKTPHVGRRVRKRAQTSARNDANERKR